MKVYTVCGKILILLRGVCYARVHIFYALRLERLFKRSVKACPHSAAIKTFCNIHRSFNSPVVRGPVFEYAGITEAWLQGNVHDSGTSCDHHECHEAKPLTFKVAKP